MRALLVLVLLAVVAADLNKLHGKVTRFAESISSVRNKINALPVQFRMAQRKVDAFRTQVLDDYQYADGVCSDYTDADGTMTDVMDLYPAACYSVMPFHPLEHDDDVSCPTTSGSPANLGFGACCDSNDQCLSGLCDLEERVCTNTCMFSTDCTATLFGAAQCDWSEEGCSYCTASNECNVDGVTGFCMVCYDYVGPVDAGVLSAAGCSEYVEVDDGNDGDLYSVDYDYEPSESICDWDMGYYKAYNGFMTDMCFEMADLLECLVPLTQIANTLYAPDCLDWPCGQDDVNMYLESYEEMCKSSAGIACMLYGTCMEEVLALNGATNGTWECPSTLVNHGGCCLTETNTTLLVNRCGFDPAGGVCVALGSAGSIVAPTVTVAVAAVSAALALFLL